LLAPPLAPPRSPPRRWHDRPLLWAAAGAAVAAAILVPIALADPGGDASGFDVRLEPWP
jgi:hypothetical protein